MKAITVLSLALLFLSRAAVAGDYIIGEGDVLDISVWGVKELAASGKVRPDGNITVPGLGDVKAAGTTTTHLQAVLAEKLKYLVKSPIVTVMVKEITNSRVYVFGGGTKSGTYDLVRKTTLLQLLCNLGEIKTADLRGAYVQRQGKRIPKDLYRLYVKGDTSEDMVIETDDVIFIPPFSGKNVYVIGAVNTPKSIEYREDMTLLEAVLEAGGFTKFAKPNETLIIRKNGESEVTLKIRAKKLLSDGDLSQDVKLRPNDYVIVKEGLF